MKIGQNPNGGKVAIEVKYEYLFTKDQIMLELKGALFKSTLKYIKRHLGEEDFQVYAERLPENVKNFLSETILTSQFYPADLLVELTESFVNFRNLDPMQTYMAIGANSADEGFSGVYKIFLKVGSPLSMIKTSKNVYKSYYSQGEMNVEKVDSHTARIQILDSGMDHVSLCSRMSGFIERTMILTGGRNVQLRHTRCTARGDDREEWIGTWD